MNKRPPPLSQNLQYRSLWMLYEKRLLQIHNIDKKRTSHFGDLKSLCWKAKKSIKRAKKMRRSVGAREFVKRLSFSLKSHLVCFLSINIIYILLLSISYNIQKYRYCRFWGTGSDLLFTPWNEWEARYTSVCYQ